MTVQVVIRDDDCSFFTRPDMLTTLYQGLWSRGYPVSLSTIASHTTRQSKVPKVRKMLKTPPYYDHNVDRKYYGTDREFGIEQNRELCRFLRDKVAQGLVEITIHGLNHNDEFLSKDRTYLTETIQKAQTLLRSVFPSEPLTTVVPPYETFSKECRELVHELGLNLSMSYEGYILHNALDILIYIGRKIATGSPGGGAKRTMKRENSGVFFGRPYFYPEKEPEKCFADAVAAFEKIDEKEGVFILVNHYWQFYEEWVTPRQELLEAWHRFTEFLFSRKGVEFTTFEKCHL